MLPDFRVVTIAVLSTFLFAVFVGFYTSSRLANERKPRPETLAAIEESPLNRIALNWPEPVQQPAKSLDLDFAVTTKVQRNPVRDVSDETIAVPVPETKVAASPPVAVLNRSLEPPVPSVASPAAEAVRSDPVNVTPQKIAPEKVEPAKVEPAKVEPAKVEPAKVEPAKVEPAKPEPVRVEQANPAPAEIPAAVVVPAKPQAKPAIVQAETRVIETVPGAAAPAPIAAPVLAPQALPEPDVPTASIVAAPRTELPASAPNEATGTQAPSAQVASRPDPVALEANPEPESATTPTADITPTDAKPPVKKARKKADRKKAKKAAKPAPRVRPRNFVSTTATTTNTLWPFFGFQQQQVR